VQFFAILNIRGRPLLAVDVTDGTTTVDAPLTALATDSLDLQDLESDDLVAARSAAITG